MREREEITGVAIKVRDKVYDLPKPKRHSDVIHMMTSLGIYGSEEDSTEGFVTNKGRFIDREEAVEVARCCGQMKRKMIGNRLNSLHLW